MKRELLINAGSRETRVAILEDDRLVELLVDRPDHRRIADRLEDVVENPFLAHYGFFVCRRYSRIAARFVWVGSVARSAVSLGE